MSNIGSRLEKLEKQKPCKKTADKTKVKNKTGETNVQIAQQSYATDIGAQALGTRVLPNLQSLRQDAQIQKQIEQRLKELIEQKS